MADDPSLQRRRTVCRGWLTKTIKNACALLERPDVLNEELELMMNDIIKRQASLNSVQEEYEMSLDDDELESDIDDSDRYCREARDAIAKIQYRLHTSRDRHGTADVTSEREDISCHAVQELGPNQGYLPKIEIGKFNGEFSAWQAFFDKFTALIHNTNLANVSKFTYLQSCLEGDAQKAIEGLSLTNDNYTIAMDILKTRFGRKERIIYGHIQNLIATDFQNSSSVKFMWNRFNQLQSNIRSLETLGVDGKNYGLILTPLIVSRLPPDIRLLWARKSHEKEADLDFLMNFLQGEIENRERSLSFEQPSASFAVAGPYSGEGGDSGGYLHKQQPRSGRASGRSQSFGQPSASFAVSSPYSGRGAGVGHLQQQYHSAGRASGRSRPSATGVALINTGAGGESCGHKPAQMDAGQCYANFGTENSRVDSDSDRANVTSKKQALKDASLCVFCSGGHESCKCRAVFKMDVDFVKLKIKENNLCFVCMKKGHVAKKCYSKCQMCKGKHNEFFCNASGTNGQSNPESESNNDSAQPHVSLFHNTMSNVSTVLQMLTVKIDGIEMNLLFDSGSDKSFITSSAVKKLRPKFEGRETIRMSGFGSNQPSLGQVRNVFGITFNLTNQQPQKLLFTEVESISAALHKPKIPQDLLSYFSPECQFSQNVSTTNNLTIDMLIGQDYYWKLIDPKETVQSPSGLVAQKTHFGLWVLSGSFQLQENNGEQPELECRQFLCLNDIPESHIRKLWDLDYLECEHQKQCHVSDVMKGFEQTITFVDGRYQVSLPWVESKKETLKCNDDQAMVRLQRLEKKLSRDQSLKDGYNEVIQDMEDRDFIEEVKEKSSDNLVYYLPHRPVVKSSSATTKIRPVFDASAPGPNGVSLNDCLETGPNLLPLLSDILIRFRTHKVAISADIEKAFLQICVRPEDRDVHRFFWKVEDQIRIMRIKRVPFGNKSSPFLLNATVRHHLSKYDQENEVVHELSQNMYVDDWLSGGDTVEEVHGMVSEASQIMSDAGMNLTKWSSNSVEVAENIQRSFQDKSVNIETNKVLGVRWNPEKDALMFDSLTVSPDVVVTKRLVLSCIARIFDPLGLISPFVVSIKILFQEIWELGLSWDEQVPDSIGQRFARWASDLVILRELSLVRSFVSISWKKKRDVELHCFCDASLKAYGAVVYIKVFEVDGSITVSLVLSKAKVSPLKPVTLPRLELLGAVTGAKLVHAVRKALELPDEVKQYCWTDSTVTLQWIKSDPTRWKMFVCNRVVQIQELTTPESWSHCIGKENPADMLTRGLSSQELLQNTMWFHGPSWLAEPQTTNTRSEISMDRMEVGQDTSDEETQLAVCMNKTQNLDEVLDTQRWGDFSKAVRIVAWIFRFVTNAKSKTKELRGLTVEELQFGKQKLLWYIQRSHFPDEINDLSNGKQIKKESVLHNIRPYLDENGLLRMTGRLQYSDLPFEEKHPIILPRCHVTILMVRREHQRLKHCGVPQMLSSLRNEFWIIGLRSLAKRVKRECVRCQRFDSSHCTQVVSPLPQERLTRTLPFSVTGLDHAGPLFTSDMVGKKMYILIFTCVVTRAIHIELCESLSLIDFMHAFRRFTSRRGMPNKVLSDNAKTFEAAAREITLRYSDESFKWVFNAPRAPWRGGIWERLVRSTKQSLKKSIGNCLLTRKELETVLVEIEFCINSRPLTYVSDDPGCSGVLSPSHFLLGRNDAHKPDSHGNDDVFEATGSYLRGCYRYASEQLDKFWKMWQEDYIRNLPQVKTSARGNGLTEGSIVMISQDNCPRLMWPLGRVLKPLPGRDGKVRTVEVKTAKGNVVRPVQKLHCLELEKFEETSLGEEVRMVNVENKRTKRGRLVKPPNRLDF